MQPKTIFSEAEYLAFEAASETKHEFWRGHVIAMAGASWKHGALTANLVAEVRARARGRCQPVASDARVRLPEGSYVYPDVVVVCGEPELTEDRPASLLNPTVLVEVLSESTAEVDRHFKLEAYTQIPSLREYWLVEQDRPHVTRYVLMDGKWVLHLEGGLETVVRSEHLGIEIPLSAVYS